MISSLVFLVLSLKIYAKGYETGYHPSAEELDSTYRQRTWTTDLIRNDQDRTKFVPRYSYNEKYKKAYHDSFYNTAAYAKPSPTVKPKLDFAVGPTSTIIEVDEPQASASQVHNAIVSYDTAKGSQIRPKFPIFFTNPATGIVYAISEVGHNLNHTSGTASDKDQIPIYIPKEQYDEDIRALRRRYESQCGSKGPSVKYVTNASVRRNNTRKTGKKRKNRPTVVTDTQVENPGKDTSSATSVFNAGTTASAIPNRPLKKPGRIIPITEPTKAVRKPSKRTRRGLEPTKPTRYVTKPEKRMKRDVKSRFLQNQAESSESSQIDFDVAQYSDRLKRTQPQSERYKLRLVTKSSKSSEEEFDISLKTDQLKGTKLKFELVPESSSFDVTPLKLITDGKSFLRNQPKSSQNNTWSVFRFSTLNPNRDKITTRFRRSTNKTESTIKVPKALGNNEISTTEKPRPTKQDFDYDDNEGDYSFFGTFTGYSDETDYEDDEEYPDEKVSFKENSKSKEAEKDDDYYYDYDNNSGFDIFQGLFAPVQMAFSKVISQAGNFFNKDEDEEADVVHVNSDKRKPKYPKYTMYNNEANAESKPPPSSVGGYFGWLGSWFKDKEGEKLVPMATVQTETTTSEPGWFGSWFGEDEKTTNSDAEEDYEDYGKWFFGWFDSKGKSATSTTTTTAKPPPSVPILTIADPLKNPQKWIGILAQHIVNSSSTTTAAPDMIEDEPKKVSYDKYQIWRLKVQDETQLRALQSYLKSEGRKVQWLKGPSLRGQTDVLVPPQQQMNFQGTLNYENILHEVLIFDVGKAIFYEENRLQQTVKKPSKLQNWHSYKDYDEIIHFCESLQVTNPHLVELIHVGRSYEGRPLVIMKLQMKKKDGNLKKKLKLKNKSGQGNGVFIEAGAHGREWISPAAAVWIANEVVKIMKSNRTTSDTEYIKNTTWYIMPLLNPDGYEYSQQFDRFWKKSRSKHIARPNGIISSAITWLNQKNPEKLCFGADLSRNWEFEGNGKESPCNENFEGPTSFSEPETRAVSKFLLNNRKEFKLFISLHSYGQTIAYPSQGNTSASSQKLEDLHDVAMVGSDGLRKKGSNSRYKIDSVTTEIGSSDAYAMNEVGIPFSFTIHLSDNGVHGYLLPASNIEPTATDAFEIITAIIDYV